jgi:hypothetical protein
MTWRGLSNDKNSLTSLRSAGTVSPETNSVPFPSPLTTRRDYGGSILTRLHTGGHVLWVTFSVGDSTRVVFKSLVISLGAPDINDRMYRIIRSADSLSRLTANIRQELLEYWFFNIWHSACVLWDGGENDTSGRVRDVYWCNSNATQKALRQFIHPSKPAVSNAAPAIYFSGALRKHIIWADY